MAQSGIGFMPPSEYGIKSHDPSEYIGQKIIATEITDEMMRIGLSGGKIIQILDQKQECCEDRYMRTDDDVQSLVGYTLCRLETKNSPDITDDIFNEHEVVFVEIGTDQGFITISSHNVRNGFYSGFELVIREDNRPWSVQPRND